MSTQNKLFINTNKTKEIIFHRPAVRNLITPPPLAGTERVKHATLLGVDVSDTLSTAAYINRLLMQVNQRLYILSLLQSYGYNALHRIFSSMLLLSINSLMPYPLMPVNLLPMTKTGSMLYLERPCNED